jgi:hypothetical protein
LWIGPGPGLFKRQRAVVTPAEVRLIGRSDERVLAWADGSVEGASGNGRWGVTGDMGSRASVPSVSFVWDVDKWGVRQQCRITSGGLVGIAFNEIAAFVDYLILTPEARRGLGVPGQVRLVIEELRSQVRSQIGTLVWKQHGVVEEPIMGDRLDLHLAIERVLAVAWTRRIGHRPVRGEPVPEPEPLVDRVRLELPRRLRAHITDQQILDRLRAMTAADPWPFDLLL